MCLGNGDDDEDRALKGAWPPHCFASAHRMGTVLGLGEAVP